MRGELKSTDNRLVYKRLKKKQDLRCALCKPHRGENQGRVAKHGHRKFNKVRK